jgi:hypothetical protein
MIKRFIKESDWTVDQFRHVLGVTRPVLTGFLERYGPRDGERYKA